MIERISEKRGVSMRKKSEEEIRYINGGRNPDNLLIQKSSPLTSLSDSDLTLSEFKILDAYLARINSHDEKKRTVVFEKGELEKLLEVDRIRKEVLDKRLRHLFQTVEVKDERQPKGFKLVNLFEVAEAVPDDDGVWQVSLTCTESAKEYIFNIESIGYLRYRLRNVVNFKSRYSYILFLYLVDNQYRGEWEVGVDELRKHLKCETERNKEYKFFNSEVLKRCQKEITECSELRYEYSPVRKGRKIGAIKIKIITIADEVEREGEKMSILPNLEIREGQTEVDYFSRACERRFTDEEMLELIALVKAAVPDEEGETEQYRLLSLQYKTFVLADKRHTIKHPFNYVKKLLSEKVREANKEREMEATTEFLSEACYNEFSPKQMSEIVLILGEKEFEGKGRPDKDLKRYDYLAKMYTKMDAAAEQSATEGNPVKNRFAYFKKMLTNDIRGQGSEQEENKQISFFDDFDEQTMRKYRDLPDDKK